MKPGSCPYTIALCSLLLALSGCANVESTGRPYLGLGHKEVPSAGFRLAANEVVWQNNPRLPIRYYAAVNVSGAQEAAKAYITKHAEQLTMALREGAPSALRKALAGVGATGDDHVIVLSPVRMEQLPGLRGVDMVVRLQVLSRTGDPVWQDELRLGSGVMILGTGWGEPSRKDAEVLARGALLALADARAIKAP